MDKDTQSKQAESKLKQDLTEAKIEIHNLKKNLDIQLKKAIENSLQLREVNSRELAEKTDESRLRLEQIQKMRQEIDHLNQKLSESEQAETKVKEELKNVTRIKENIDAENGQVRHQIKNLETEQNTLIKLLNLPPNERNFISLKKALENILQNNEILSKQVSEANAKAKLQEQKLKQEIDNLKKKTEGRNSKI